MRIRHHDYMVLTLIALIIILIMVSSLQSFVLFREEPYVEESPELEGMKALLQTNNELRVAVLEKEAELALVKANNSYLQQCLEEALARGEGITPPQVRIGADTLRLEENYVRFDVTGVEVGIVSDSKSMVPILDENNLVLEIMPKSPGEIRVGDIIIYELNGERIIHRVIEVGADDDAWFVIAKGDNNPVADPEKVRWQQIRGVVIGIMY